MLTKYFGKLLGFGIVLVVLGLLVDKPAAIDTMNRLFSDSELLWVAGVFTTLLGLAVVLAHNRWSGGWFPVMVTIYGWLGTIKGLLFVWLPSSTQTGFYQSLRFEQTFYPILIVALVLGCVLIYGGFTYRGSTA
ncbi:MAG TPA: hypothetical protein VHT92_01975 [Candidatus Cybelea sp.]|jgi:hypothetical protein|nr:hypothetical protein [Candidatus Cybelea sp.]